VSCKLLAILASWQNEPIALARFVSQGLAVRRALETAGVEFIDENGGGPGVRLQKGHRKKDRD
jgi:hypothetical protein